MAKKEANKKKNKVEITENNQSPEHKDADMMKKDKSSTEKSPETQRQLYILGSSLGILVIIIALFSAIYLVTNLGNEPEQTDIIVLEKRSPDEIKIDEMINDLQEEMNSIDANEDFSEFVDSEFAVAEDEEELEIAIDDIDQMMSDLEQLEQDLEDFDEEDF